VSFLDTLHCISQPKSLLHLRESGKVLLEHPLVELLKKKMIYLGHLWHAGRARAAAAGFEKGIDRDLEPVLSRDPEEKSWVSTELKQYTDGSSKPKPPFFSYWASISFLNKTKEDLVTIGNKLFCIFIHRSFTHIYSIGILKCKRDAICVDRREENVTLLTKALQQLCGYKGTHKLSHLVVNREKDSSDFLVPENILSIS
jgi:hypothetical protein